MSNDTDSPDSLCSGGFLAAISAAALGMAYYGSRFFSEPPSSSTLEDKSQLREIMTELKQQVTQEKEECDLIQERMAEFEQVCEGYYGGLSEIYKNKGSNLGDSLIKPTLLKPDDMSQISNVPLEALNKREKRKALGNMLSNYPQPPHVQRPTYDQLHDFCCKRATYHAEVKELASVVFNDFSHLLMDSQDTLQQNKQFLDAKPMTF